MVIVMDTYILLKKPHTYHCHGNQTIAATTKKDLKVFASIAFNLRLLRQGVIFGLYLLNNIALLEI